MDKQKLYDEAHRLLARAMHLLEEARERHEVEVKRRKGDVPSEHEFDENGKCKWCPERA